MLREPGPSELDIDLSQLKDIDARRQQTASKALYARSVLALRKIVPTTSSPNDTAAPPSTTVPSTACTASAYFDNQLFMSQPADNTLDHNEIEQIRQFVASQNGSVSEGNGPTAMSQEQDKVSTKYPSGVTVVENLMNRDEPQPVVASSSKSSEAPDAAAVTGIQGSVDENVASEWPEVQEEDSTGFDIIETWYSTLESPTLEDTVHYEKAKQKDARRRERIASRKALEEAEQTLETFPDLFDDELLNSSLESLPGDTGRRSDMPSANRPSKGPRKQKNRVSAAERRRSMQLGLESALGRVTRNKGSGKKRSRKRKADDSEEDIPASSNVSKKHLFDPEFDLNAFLNFDVIADAQANAGLPAIPISNSKNKKSALAELVASIPSADQDQAKSDRQAILEATTKFRHKARPDGKGGWRIKGMKTSLFHHQLLGVAWMRDRENSGGPPYGGFLCDVMGYGKTIQALGSAKSSSISRMRSIDIIQSLQKFSVIFITEFYPHFDFLEYPDTNDYSQFVKRYCVGDEAQQRLRNLCRTYILLRTHSSRLFSLPIIKLPDIGESVIKVDFCDVERRIYDEVLEQFIANINGLSDVTNPYLSQCRCFLTMILKFRMISSHLLTTQNLVKGLLNSSLMRDLVEIARETRDPDHPSAQIIKWFMTLKKGVSLPAAPPDNEDLSQSRNELNGDREELVKQFHKFTTELHENGQWDERLRRTSCPHCELTPIGPIITSCMHLYCEECYFILKNSLTSADGKPVCQTCNNPIAEAAYCGTAERIVLDEPSVTSSLTQNNTRRTKTSSQKKSSKLFGSPMFATATQRSRMKYTGDKQQNEDEELDWISAAQGGMPGAKVDKVRGLVANWVREDPDAKVVVFTQFLDFVRIFSSICAKEGWAHCRNEAVQQQAFCRLYRIGQEKVVEVVKIIVQNTIDDYILQLQTKKSVNINKAIGEEALQKRDKIIDLLKMFAEVEVQENGGIRVEISPKGEQADKGDQAKAASKAM
ncbi:SNF2 family helicase [Aspergillus fumigatus Z5]|nr:SNF2 family helicase [Aspergillus fumigatus Z5]